MIKSIKIALVIAWVAISVFLNYGCVQVISDKTEHGPRLKINTFLMRSGIESFHHDPNSFDVGKYTGVPANLKLKFNQLTGQWEAYTESGE